MLLHIIARGKIGRGAEAELIDRYLKRISWPVKVTELAESGKLPPPGDNSVTILLDEKGESLGSIALARRLERWRDGGKREARFLIGGADGFADDERAGADLLLAFDARPGRICSPASCSPSSVPRDEHPCQPSLSTRR